MGALGNRILNQLGVNFLGVDFDAEKQRQAERQRMAELQQQAAAILSPAGMARQEAPVIAPDGADITAAFGPQGAMVQQPQRNPQQIAAELAKLTSMGLNPKPYVDLAQYAKPEIGVQDGFRYDKATGEDVGGYHPQLDKGQEPLYDAKGNIVAIRNMDGAIQSAADMAGAVKGAEARASAPYDFIKAEGPDGTPLTVAKSAAAGRTFTGQSPTDALKATAQANAQITLPADLNGIDTAIDTAKALRNHPALDMRTGGWSMLPAVPGTPGAAFEAYKQQVLGQGFMSARQALKGGGQITDYEGGKAEQAIIRAKAAQSPKDFQAAIDDYIGALQRGRSIMQQKAGGAPSAPSAPSRPNLSAIPAADRLAEARRRGLIK